MSKETLPPLVDEVALKAFLDERLGGGGSIAVERHQAGHSNETFFVTHAGTEYVLRRPPRGAFLPTAHDVMREYRVLTGLSNTPVRSPTAVLACEDESIIGALFYLMQRMHGVVIRDRLPDTFGEAESAAIGDELVDALVELHLVDPESCGLGDFSKRTGYLQRQLKRWSGQLELTLPMTRPLPELQEVGRWLADKLPASVRATVVHGDYKLDNVMFEPSPPARLVAILDWEMSTLGDPLADLGWMISFWREADDADVDEFADLNAVTALPGFRRRAELIDRYASATGFEVGELDWYVVLAIWKLAILLEGSYARHLSGVTDDPFFAQLERGVPALARRALDIIDAR